MNCSRCGISEALWEARRDEEGRPVFRSTFLYVEDEDGRVVEAVCPDCMTSEELEATWRAAG